MIQRFGIDTSILVRLLTGDPEDGFRVCLGALTELREHDGAEILASNQVIGEAYVAVQHHYGISKTDVRAALTSVLTSGLVAPLNGSSVLSALEITAGCGLIDRLIADDYRQTGVRTLTLDRRMSKLPDTELLVE